jgi:hypothetical protein
MPRPKFRVDASFWKQDDDKFDEEALERIDALEKKLQFVFSMDAGESAFFARELEYIKSKTYDIQYPKLRAQELLPVSTEAGPGANSITYRQYNMVGQMKFIAQYAKDLPRVDIYGKEFTAFVKSLGESYGYTIQEVRNAMYANVPLQQRKANTARLAYEQAINRNAWFADGSATYAGCMGMFYNPNITQMAAPTGLWCDATGASLGKTPDQIIADVNAAINYVPQLTKDVEYVDTVAIPVISLSYLKNTPRSTISDTTIYGFLKENHPDVSFEALNEAWAVTPSPATPTNANSSSNVLLAYNMCPD